MSAPRSLRACMVCSRIQEQKEFIQKGCPNCEEFLELRSNPDAVQDCTSQVFEGMIAMGQPGPSWVAKWQRVKNCKEGLYAVKVEGVLPDDYISAAEAAGVRYVPRDGSAQEEQ